MIVDKLFAHNIFGNCELDTDKILLDIANVTLLQKKSTTVGRDVAVNIEPFAVGMPAPSLEKKNVVAYMAGYLMKKYPLDNCSICKEMYKLEELPQSSPFSE